MAKDKNKTTGKVQKNKQIYIEIGESSHRISSRKIYLDELVVLRDALKRFKEKLTVKKKNNMKHYYEQEDVQEKQK